MINLSLPLDFIDKYILPANPSYAMVYLCAYRFSSQGSAIPKSSQIAKILGMKTSDVNDAVEYWTNEGFDIFKRTKTSVSHPDKSIYSPTEIANQASSDKKLQLLYKVAEKLLCKILSTGDMQTLFWIYDYLGLPAEVITLILNYASKQEKTNMRYIEKIAMNWADQNIDTTKKAEAHLALLEQRKTYESHIKKLLDDNNKEFTPTEKNIISEWESTLKPNDDLITEAIKLNITRTGKISIRYINGILKSWAEKGITLPIQIASETKSSTASKFTNFTQRSDVDYNKIALDAFQKRIKKSNTNS